MEPTRALRPEALTGSAIWLQGDFVVLASEPVCICGVDVAAPQQLRVRNSQQKMSMAELRSIFSRQFTEYEVRGQPHGNLNICRYTCTPAALRGCA